MNILNELLMLSEAKGKNLLGLTINDKKITEKTKSETWLGDFVCDNNKLTTLKGAPVSVGGGFYCSNNQLTSLEGAPTSVGGDFWCYKNKLTSLEGAPASVIGYFDCDYNQLTSLEGAPTSVGGDFICANNKLTTLKGAPSSVGSNFYCYNNQLTSLTSIHKILKQMNGIFYANKNPLKSNIIGLLLVKGCNKVELDNKQVEEIINRHMKSPFGHLRVLECQSEMLDADLGEWAEL